MPTFNLLYFKNIIDCVMVDFFQKYNKEFISINGSYFLSSQISKTIIKQFITHSVKKQLQKIVAPYDILNPQVYLILGSCFPDQNLLLKYKNNSYFPQKLQKLIDLKMQIKYVMKEKDIKIDIAAFNQIIQEVFDSFFNSVISKNIIFISNSRLDCYMLFKTIKGLYGSKHCKNLFLELYKDQKAPLISVNELIDKYIKKNYLKDDIQYIRCQKEISDFLKLKTGF